MINIRLQHGTKNSTKFTVSGRISLLNVAYLRASGQRCPTTDLGGNPWPWGGIHSFNYKAFKA